MATNKNAVLRYNTLDRCFSNFQRRFYFEDLIEVVSEVLWKFDLELEGIKPGSCVTTFDLCEVQKVMMHQSFRFVMGKKHTTDMKTTNFLFTKSH